MKYWEEHVHLLIKSALCTWGGSGTTKFLDAGYAKELNSPTRMVLHFPQEDTAQNLQHGLDQDHSHTVPNQIAPPQNRTSEFVLCFWPWLTSGFIISLWNKSKQWKVILMQIWFPGLANLVFFPKKVWSHRSYTFVSWKGFICDITLKRDEIFHNFASYASWFLTRLIKFSVRSNLYVESKSLGLTSMFMTLIFFKTNQGGLGKIWLFFGEI